AEKHRKPGPVFVREPIPGGVWAADAAPRSRRVFLAEGPAARFSVRRGAEAAGQWTLPEGRVA
ncbi:MAG TPA: hypothetical protein VGK13_00200, partial [Methanocellaceae archaeon]